MRAFFCVPIERENRVRIERLATWLRETTSMRANWVATENYHITARFLGDIEPDWIPDLEQAARAACVTVSPVVAVADTIGAFPAIERARVLWVGGKAPEALQQLNMQLEKHLQMLGFPRSQPDRGFHVTMARVKGRTHPRLADAIERVQPSPHVELPIDRLVLMESTLHAHGAQYAPLFTIRFGEGG